MTAKKTHAMRVSFDKFILKWQKIEMSVQNVYKWDE